MHGLRRTRPSAASVEARKNTSLSTSYQTTSSEINTVLSAAVTASRAENAGTLLSGHLIEIGARLNSDTVHETGKARASKIGLPFCVRIVPW